MAGGAKVGHQELMSPPNTQREWEWSPHLEMDMTHGTGSMSRRMSVLYPPRTRYIELL